MAIGFFSITWHPNICENLGVTEGGRHLLPPRSAFSFASIAALQKSSNACKGGGGAREKGNLYALTSNRLWRRPGHQENSQPTAGNRKCAITSGEDERRTKSTRVNKTSTHRDGVHCLGPLSARATGCS